MQQVKGSIPAEATAEKVGKASNRSTCYIILSGNKHYYPIYQAHQIIRDSMAGVL